MKNRKKVKKRFNSKKLKDLKAEIFRGALDSVGGHYGKAAEILGIHVSTLYRFFRKMRAVPALYGEKGQK